MLRCHGHNSIKDYLTMTKEAESTTLMESEMLTGTTPYSRVDTILQHTKSGTLTHGRKVSATTRRPRTGVTRHKKQLQNMESDDALFIKEELA